MDELISRQAAIDSLDGEIEITGRVNAETVKGYVKLVKDRIERLPPAQPERKTGKWVRGREIARDMLGDVTLHTYYKDFTCSNCGLILEDLLYRIDGSPFYKYCPNCGAKMEEQDG